MGNKLYVGNLPYSYRDSDMEQAFSQYGTVSSAKVMMERDTGRSKGFGFVEMSTDAEAKAAIEERIIYPAFRAVFQDPHMIYEAVEAHQLAHVLLDKLNKFRPGPGSATFDARFKVLRELVKHHVDEEESRVFPKAEAHELDWKSLFEKAQKIKQQPPEKRQKKSRSKSPHGRAA